MEVLGDILVVICLPLFFAFVFLLVHVEQVRSFRRLFVDRDRVIAVLSGLAVKFQKACDEQTAIQKRDIPLHKDPAKVVRECAFEIEAAKKAFWDAIKKAKSFLYISQVPKSFREYLPENVGDTLKEMRFQEDLAKIGSGPHGVL